MGFLFKQKKERLVAIFDIGSGSVGGAMVRIPLDHKSIPTIIKSVHSNEININGELDFNALLRGMISALSLTANSLYNKKIGAPEEIYCILASPWYLSETRIIKMTRDTSFTFSKHLANELIQREISNLKEVYKDKYRSVDGSPEIIEQQIMAVFLNGYKIDFPLGTLCKSVQIDMAISLAPALCLNKMRETLSKTFHHKDVNFSSFPLSTYLAVRDKYVNEESYLLLDISGEVTDVGIVTGGILKTVLSFPFGKKTFFNYMCSKLDIELRDAKELFKLYSQDNLSTELKNKVTPLFKSIENSWGEAFRQCISTLPRTLLLPNTIFLTADNDIKNWFADVLRNEKYTQSVIFDRECNVITLDGPEFLNMCNVKEGPCDPFLMIEAISIMRKTVK